MMLGYLHKDQAQPHFQVRLWNINPGDIIKGQAEWQTAKLSYEDDKIMITKPNIFHRLSTFRLNSDPESDNTFLEEMTNMLNTKKYMVSTSFITQTGALRLGAAESMWKLVKGHSMTTSDTEKLFFQQQFTPYRPGAAAPGQRYFDAETSRATTAPDTDTITQTSRPPRASWRLTTRRAPCPVSLLTTSRLLSAVSWMRSRRACAPIRSPRHGLRLPCVRPRTPRMRMLRRQSVRTLPGRATPVSTTPTATSSMTTSSTGSPCARVTGRAGCKTSVDRFYRCAAMMCQ